MSSIRRAGINEQIIDISLILGSFHVPYSNAIGPDGGAQAKQVGQVCRYRS